MGLLEPIRAAQLPQQGMRYVDDRGRTLAELGVEMFGGQGPVADLEILRGDLTRVLFELVAGRVDLRFGDSIAALAPDDRGVDVTFEHGAPERFDLVVAADGLHSRVRRLVWGPEADYVRSLGGVTSFFDVPEPEPLDGWSLMDILPGRRMVLIRPDAAPGPFEGDPDVVRRPPPPRPPRRRGPEGPRAIGPRRRRLAPAGALGGTRHHARVLLRLARAGAHARALARPRRAARRRRLLHVTAQRPGHRARPHRRLRARERAGPPPRGRGRRRTAGVRARDGAAHRGRPRAAAGVGIVRHAEVPHRASGCCTPTSAPRRVRRCSRSSRRR